MTISKGDIVINLNVHMQSYKNTVKLIWQYIKETPSISMFISKYPIRHCDLVFIKFFKEKICKDKWNSF